MISERDTARTFWYPSKSFGPTWMYASGHWKVINWKNKEQPKASLEARLFIDLFIDVAKQSPNIMLWPLSVPDHYLFLDQNQYEQTVQVWVDQMKGLPQCSHMFQMFTECVSNDLFWIMIARTTTVKTPHNSIRWNIKYRRAQFKNSHLDRDPWILDGWISDYFILQRFWILHYSTVSRFDW